MAASHRHDNPVLTRQPRVVTLADVRTPPEPTRHDLLISELKRVRSEAIEHIRAAQLLAQQRRRLMEEFMAEGFSQSDLARELGVTRQAIQKMLAAGRDRAR